MRYHLLIPMLFMALTGCAVVDSVVQKDATTTFTQETLTCNNGKCVVTAKQVLKITGKPDAIATYKNGEFGGTVDNRGAKSFGRTLAEKLVENSAVVLSTADQVDSK